MTRPALAAFAIVVILLGAGVAAAQTDAADGADRADTFAAGPAVSVIVHHPFDGVDGLGFDWNGTGVDAFVARYAARLDPERDGFGYPSLLVDGVTFMDGLPAGDDPGRTQELYEAALARRVQGEARPVTATLDVASLPGRTGIDAMVVATPVGNLSGESITAWLALVEDHVHYAPAAAISNGVTNHRATLRHLAHLGDVDADGLRSRTTIPLDDAWDRDQLAFVVWLQADSAGERLGNGEVVTATTHPVTQTTPTRQAEPGVLLELLSATWCDPCLFGDDAIDAILNQHGHAALQSTPEGGAVYARRAPAATFVIAALAGLAAALVAWNPRRPDGDGGAP